MELDEKPAKKGANKKDNKHDGQDEPTPKKTAKPKKGKKKQQKHEESSEEEEAQKKGSGESAESEDEESSAYKKKPVQVKEVTAAERKKAKKLRDQQAKQDPADSFDPLNMKPARAPGIDDDLKAQIAKFGFRCSACPFGTDTNEEFKTHFKSEWHRVNLKRKVGEQAPLTEEQFKEMVILKEFA